MELSEAIRTNGTCRFYKPDEVPGALIAKLLRAAQLGPSGSNRQPLKYLVVRDPDKRRGLQELYLPVWRTYLEKMRGGDKSVGRTEKLVNNADHYAKHMAEVPVQIVMCYDIADIVPVDAALDRPSVAGGASIYPMIQNLLLAARDEGLGSTLTTLLSVVEPGVRTLLEIPQTVAIAAVVGIGWPARPFPQKLNRRPLNDISFADTYGTALPEVQNT